MIKGDLISDLELRLSSSKPSDDSDISRLQLSDWIDMARDSYYASTLNQNFDRDLVFKEEELSIQLEDNAENEDRYYVALSHLPLNNPLHNGIIKVSTDSGNTVYEERFENIQELKNLFFAKPSATNLVYWLEGKRIYIEGLTALSYTQNKINLHYIPSEVDRAAAETDEYLLSPADKDLILKIAFEIGMNQFGLDFEDNENDGE